MTESARAVRTGDGTSDVKLCAKWGKKCEISRYCEFLFVLNTISNITSQLPFVLQDYISLGDLDENIYEVTKIRDDKEKL